MEEGRRLDEAIDRHFSSPDAPSEYKPLIYEIVSGVVRWKGYLDWLLSHFVKESIKKDVRCLLRASLYQIFFMKKAAYHVVGEAVDHAKKEKGRTVAGFVNAVLRRAIREKDRLALPTDKVLRLSVEQSFPPWLVRRWHVRFGEEGLAALLGALNQTPEFTLRVNLRKISREEATRKLAEKAIRARSGRLLEGALLVERVGPLLDDQLFKTGLVHVQDEASQVATLSLSPGTSDLILDACAGLGTKTQQIKEEWPASRVVAMDLKTGKLLSVRAIACAVGGDALKNPFKRGAVDSILLDAPCSSLGIIRKHPEIKWRRREQDVAAFGGVQREMIRSLGESLRRGGHLVYSVCSFEPEETTEVVEQVLSEGSFAREKALPGLIPDDYFLSLPHVSGMDGFFIARLRKL